MIGTATYNPRTENVNFRVTPAEKQALEQRAQAESRTVSDWLRLVALSRAWGTGG
jgi:uncharacterized protein (DUF1778 family)